MIRKPASKKKANAPKKRKKATAQKSRRRASAKPAKKTTAQKNKRPVARKAAVLRKRRKKTATRRRAKPQGWTWPAWTKTLFRFTYKVAFFSYVILMAGAMLVYVYSRDLPNPNVVSAQNHPPRITLLDKDDQFITTYGQYFGDPVKVAELPPHVVHAFIATEDRNFFHHMGINPISIGRAMFINVSSGDVRQGGSTITQQLAKNLFLSPERTMKRKAQEVLLSVWLETNYTKEEILELYFNNVYFGAGAYGLQAAAERYFSKSPSDLHFGEAAMLAGLLKAPSRYAPSSNISAARERASVVLGAMVDAEFMDQDQADAIRARKIASVVERPVIAPYAIDYAISEMKSKLGKAPENIIIRTTIDIAALKKSEEAFLKAPQKDPLITDDTQIAALTLERDGAIRVLLGGRDYSTSEYNRVTSAKRQPGSSFKPWIFLAALEQGYKPEDIIEDTPIEIGEWSPKNYKDKYYDAVPMTEALSRSLNAAAIRLQELVGRESVVRLAKASGFHKLQDPGPALALGVMEVTPLDLAGAFSVFANDGVPTTPYIIRSIITEKGNTLYQHQNEIGQPITDSETMIAMNYMLRSVVASGSGVHARLRGHKAAGKTGTTQDSRDAWFAGHASGMVGVVWLGKDNNAPMTVGDEYISGSAAPARIWRDVMTASLEGRPAEIPLAYVPERRIIDILGDSFLSLVSDVQTVQPMVDDRGNRPASIDDLLLDVLGNEEIGSNGWAAVDGNG